MIILTDDLYNNIDRLYLKRDDLQRTIYTLQHEQRALHNDMEQHDTYTLYKDLEAELEQLIEEIEELEYHASDLELMEQSFEEYSNMELEELQAEAEAYGLPTSGNELQLFNRIMVKIFN